MVKKQDLEQAINEAELELSKFEKAFDELEVGKSYSAWRNYYSMSIKLIKDRIEFLKLELNKLK